MSTSPRGISRRTVMSAMAAGAAVTGLGASTRPASAAETGAADTAADDARHRPRRLRPVSMAMHIHGPFSEGIGSFEAHLSEARRTGVDVIWWTDHDFRVAAWDHRRAVHFNGQSEPEGTLSWTWAKKIEGTLAAESVGFVGDQYTPDDPSSALRLSATGGGTDGGILWYQGTAWNFSYSTCLADTTLELDVRLDPAAADGSVMLRMELSYHPARAGLPAGQYILRYRFGGVSQRRHVADGLIGTVDVPAEPGGWHRFTLPLVDDINALWPDLVAEDNSLRNLRVGVSAAAGKTVTGFVDRLLFHRARRDGQQGEDLREEVLDRYRYEYADVAHHRSYEVSLVRHLNWYGGDQTMPTFPSPPLRDNDPALTESMVNFLHAHGGIVCWNHPMDVETKESLATLMIERNNLGAELVEIGREPLNDLLWVFDVAARNAVFFTAVGASDDHGGKNWLDQEEPWITYAWAESTEVEDLVEALRKGRAWFTDPRVYRGSLNLAVNGRPAMGSVVCSRAPVVVVEVTATDVPADATVEVITGVVDRAGAADLTPSTEVMPVDPTLLTDGPLRLAVQPGNGKYVRTQVRAADGTVIAVSNPVWLLPHASDDDVPDARSFG